ncbi:SRPBCC domain-containing protein [Sciscionella sediminilitoris]|uniref:SRPBCC domain-containing protein n=1 Tax=Sciscionella sediminilitoris TaxID=1445613 RepID=UPI0004DF9457|nr:SRPBCC domain-containing protein [Sciscionella sp. SE31]
MGFPDRIERTVELAHPPEVVWRALTTAEGLGTWFGDESARIELRPGGTARLTWSHGHAVDMVVERVAEPRVFAFSWPASDGENPVHTHVEFTLEPTGSGTRLTMIETGFAQLPGQEAYESHTEGWTRELGELVDYLNAA